MAVISWLAGALIPTFYTIAGLVAPDGAVASNTILYYININSYIWSFSVAFILYLILGRTKKYMGRSFVSAKEHDELTENV
jgi:hypothetical protein